MVSINPNTTYYIRYHRLLRCETHYFVINSLCNNVNDDNVHRFTNNSQFFTACFFQPDKLQSTKIRKPTRGKLEQQ